MIWLSEKVGIGVIPSLVLLTWSTCYVEFFVLGYGVMGLVFRCRVYLGFCIFGSVALSSKKNPPQEI